MIAYNLDYSTLVPDDSKIPDSMCNVIEWEDHLGCNCDPVIIRKNEYSARIKIIEDEIKLLRAKRDKTKDKLYKIKINKQIDDKKKEKKPWVEKRGECAKKKPKHIMCTPRRYRFLKSKYGLGVMPTVLQDLLQARANTRKQIKQLKKQDKSNMTDEEIEQINLLISVLDKRQLAYKVSANSGYGATGVQRGYLPCMPIAMATCAMGRENIKIVADVIPKKYGGILVYGDRSCHQQGALKAVLLPSRL